MKSDIIIPKVENVFLAAVQEWSDDFNDTVWYVYLVNDSDYDLDSLMLVSKAFGTIDGEMKKPRCCDTPLWKFRLYRCKK